MEQLQIVHADDEELLHFLVENFLREAFPDRNVQATHVYDGAALIDAVKKKNPSLIVTDHNMPNQTGYEALAALQQESSKYKIPTLLVTGKSWEVEEQMNKLEKTILIEKPFAGERFIDAARLVFRKPRLASRELNGKELTLLARSAYQLKLLRRDEQNFEKIYEGYSQAIDEWKRTNPDFHNYLMYGYAAGGTPEFMAEHFDNPQNPLTKIIAQMHKEREALRS